MAWRYRHVYALASLTFLIFLLLTSSYLKFSMQKYLIFVFLRCFTSWISVFRAWSHHDREDTVLSPHILEPSYKYSLSWVTGQLHWPCWQLHWSVTRLFALLKRLESILLKESSSVPAPREGGREGPGLLLGPGYIAEHEKPCLIPLTVICATHSPQGDFVTRCRVKFKQIWTMNFQSETISDLENWLRSFPSWKCFCSHTKWGIRTTASSLLSGALMQS